jgi:enhancer of mRNA-decapping protein 3
VDEIIPPVAAQSVLVKPVPSQFTTPALPHPKPSTFEDPAILYMGRKPNISTPAPIELPTIPGSHSRRVSAVSIPPLEREISSAAVLVDPLSELEVRGNGKSVLGNGNDEEPAENNMKRNRRRRARRGGKHASDVPDGDENVPVATETKRGKGWRQTPLLEPNPSFQPFSTLKKRGRRTDENGWATEDATDVQDMGDFDFESNLSKFDKKTVFDGLKAQDIITDGDRLVGHNRLPKPGTAGGKNFLPTENVLDGLKENTTWKSEADSDPDVANVSQRDTGSGRQSRRAESRLRRPMSRKGSSIPPLATNRPPSGYECVSVFTFLSLCLRHSCNVDLTLLLPASSVTRKSLTSIL